MAKRVFNQITFTPTATADASALANATYMAIKGGSATQLINIVEIFMGGQAASVSSPCIMQFARSSTLGATPTALAAPNGDGPLHPSTAPLAAPPVTYVAASTGPLRSATVADKMLNLSFNAYGGAVIWQAPTDGSGPAILTATAPLGEASLSAYTGGTVGAMGAHIIYEPA